MAITVNRITVATPTLNAITLGAGGSLVVGTTYYYRIIALRQTYRYCLSAASAEQSVTPTAGNQTAQLSWAAVANANAYILQRTTTSGSYPLEGQNTFNLNGQAYATNPYATTLTSQNDDGGATTNVRFNSYNLDFDTEHALIEAYESSYANTVTLWQIASALSAGGFTDLQLMGSALWQAGTNWRDQGIYLLRGHLCLHDCTFQMRGPLIGIPGDIFFGANVVAAIGHATTNYSPVYIRQGMPAIGYTNNGNTYTGNYPGGNYFAGRTGSTGIMRMFVERKATYDPVGNYGSITSDKLSNYGGVSNTDVIDSVVGLGSQNGWGLSLTANSKDNVLESARPLTACILKDSIIKNSGYLNAYNMNNIDIKGCTTIRQETSDIVTWYNSQKAVSCVDHVFKGKGQTDNQPYWRWYKPATQESTTIISVTRNFLVTNKSGSPLSGAVITAANGNGLSAFWSDSTATFSTTFDNVTDPVSMTVSDGTKFGINDYIRGECYGEVLKVTNIVGNVLTVARAQLGTTKRYHIGSEGTRRVLKMVASVTTDANGKVVNAESILQRELWSNPGANSNATGYEDALLTAGHGNRAFYGPYVLTISKTGYKDYVAKLLDPAENKYPLGPQTLEITMTPIDHPPASWGQ